MVIHRDSERAQLILAGAFALAVALIGLTIVFSAGNFTASLAGESGTVSQGDDAVTARESVRADVRSYLRIENGRSNSYSNKRTNIASVLAQVGERTANLYAAQGRDVRVGSPSFAQGTRIKQVGATGPTYDTFREPGERGSTDNPADTWELTNGGTVRNMTFHFTQVPLLAEDPFELQFRSVSGPTQWDIEVKQGGATTWEITVTDGSETYTCERPTAGLTKYRMDVSDAEMDGTYCRALDQIDMASTNYRVVVNTPDADSPLSRTFAKGKFWVVVTHGDVPSLDTTGTVDVSDEVVYSTTVPFRYRSAAVEFESDITVAPGEIE